MCFRLVGLSERTHQFGTIIDSEAMQYAFGLTSLGQMYGPTWENIPEVADAISSRCFRAGTSGRLQGMPTVDVIIPTYNTAKYLPIAIESVIAQTFDDWRILLIDDGSTDDTAGVVAPFLAKLGNKIKYISQPNGGVSSARNNGLRNASAEFIALLDADDVWLPCRLTESLRCFESRPGVGLAYGLISRIDANGAVIDTFAGNRKHAEGRVAPYIYMRRIQLPTSSMTFRKACVDKVGRFDESLRATEDRDLWLRMAFHYEVAFAPTVISLYRTSGDSLTTDTNGMLKAQLQFIEKHYGSPGCGVVARRVALSYIYRQRAEAFGIRKQMWGAVKSSLRALALNPLDISNARTAGSLLLRSAGIYR
jgi:glycosyltransferase involved in cell wall biosynthesis